MYNKDLNNKIEIAYSFLNNDADKSLQLFDKVLNDYPNNVKALNGKASALIKLNKINEADITLDKSISIEETSNAYINKGIISKKRLEFSDALKYYNKALKINNNLNNIIETLKKDIEENIKNEDMKKNISKFSSEVQTLINEAIKYKNMDKLWDALDYFELAVKNEPLCEEMIIKDIIDIKRILQKEFIFKQPKINDTESSKLKIQAIKCVLENNQSLALVKCNEILNINNNDLDALNIKGCILFYFNDFDSAIYCYDKCLNIDKNHIHSLYNKALIFRRIRKYKEAIGCLNKLIEICGSSDVFNIYKNELIERLSIILEVN